MAATTTRHKGSLPPDIARTAIAQMVILLVVLSLYTYGLVGLMEVGSHPQQVYPWSIVYGACAMFASIGLLAVCVWHTARITSDQQELRTGHRSHPAG